MPVSRSGTLFALAWIAAACHGGDKRDPRQSKPDASDGAEVAATRDAALGPPSVPLPVVEDLPAPVAHTTLETRLPGGRVLASGRRGVSDAIVAGAYVYFASATDGTIQRVPLAGGAFELVASGQAQPHRLAAHGAALYWIDRGVVTDAASDAHAGGTLMRAPLAGGPVQVLATGLADPVALALAGSDVIVATRGSAEAGFKDGALWRVPAAGGHAAALATGLAEPAALTLAGERIFVATRQDRSIWQVPRRGGKPELFVAGVDHPVALLVDGARLLWVAQGSGGGEGEIAARPLAGGSTEWLADALEHPRAAVLARGQLAWLAEGPDGREPARWASLFVRGKDGKSDLRLSTPHGVRSLVAAPDGWVMAGPSEISFVPFQPAAQKRAYELVAPAPGQPRALAADRDGFYWVSYQGAVMKAARAGGAPVVLAHAPRGLSAMALDAGQLAWTCYDAGSVGRVATRGGAPVELASARPHPIAIAARAGEIYFADDEGVQEVAAEGGPVRRLAQLGGTPHALAVDDQAAYVLAAGPAGDRLLRVPLSGAPLELLADGLAGADALAVAGEWIYWLDEDADADFANARGQIWRMPRRGGGAGVRALAERLAAGLASPNGLAVGAGFVWFAYADGRVARVPQAGGSIEVVAGPGRNVGALCPDGGDVLVASGGTLAGDWKDGAILRLRLPK